MRAVILAGVFLLCAVVFLAGTILPDTTEATILSWTANRASDLKRNAVMNSIEMQTALIEIEELEAKLASYETSCPSLTGDDDEGLLAKFGIKFPW